MLSESPPASFSRLSNAKKGQQFRVVGFDFPPNSTPSHSIKRLWELGVVPEATLAVVHQAPVFKDPVVIELSGTRFAFRRSELSEVLVVAIDGASK